MHKSTFAIGLAIALATVCLWAWFNRPDVEPVWPRHVQGFSFSPMRAGQSPLDHRLPSSAQIDEDLKLLSGKAHAVRTYTVEGVMGQVPELAARHGLNVALGAWIDADMVKNQREMRVFESVVSQHDNIVRAIVGNEVVLRGDIPMERLIGYLDRAREVSKVPISTAEPWHVWMKHPELADHVDFLAVHMLPYWEGVDVDLAVDYIAQRFNALRQVFPDKPIVIAEVGWPSNGRTRQGAVASETNQAIFLRRFLARAQTEKYVYYIMEAFDQPWKADTEGAVGAYWGVYDVDRQPKFPFTAPIVAMPNWRYLAGVTVLLASFVLAVMLMDSRTLGKRGRGFLAVVVFGAATGAVWIIDDYINQYLTIPIVLVGLLMLAGMTGVILVLFAEAHEWAEALWIRERRRALHPSPLVGGIEPQVSIHVPIHNEPPDMVIATLVALTRLDYSNFEVLVVDNNTKDPDTWTPVRDHCLRLGPRFRFFHVDPLTGYKAGALNFALGHTAPGAEIIAVIDSDYVVDPAWLKDLVPQFANPKVSIVQAPQDYRDDRENAFKAMCHAEYRGFFYIGMITRNERNAIIQHGTMTLVRRCALESTGRWSEWSITEDAELGLRIFEHGGEALYIPRSYGQGLMPDNYLDFKKQRFRWAYGAVQIMRRHCDDLFTLKPGRLRTGQRYHFIAGWLPWMADGVNLLVTIGALLWTLAMFMAPRSIDPPLAQLSLFPLVLFAFKTLKLIYLYRYQVRAGMRQALAAALAGLSLSHTISKAVLLGLITSDKPFFRTPKKVRHQPLLQAINSSREEILFLVALNLAAGGIASQGMLSPDHTLWFTVLLVLSLPYWASLLVAMISALPSLPSWLFWKSPAPCSFFSFPVEGRPGTSALEEPSPLTEVSAGIDGPHLEPSTPQGLN